MGLVHANPLLSVLDIVESERRCRCTRIAVPWRIVESFEERGMVRRVVMACFESRFKVVRL